MSLEQDIREQIEEEEERRRKPLYVTIHSYGVDPLALGEPCALPRGLSGKAGNFPGLVGAQVPPFVQSPAERDERIRIEQEHGADVDGVEPRPNKGAGKPGWRPANEVLYELRREE